MYVDSCKGGQMYCCELWSRDIGTIETYLMPALFHTCHDLLQAGKTIQMTGAYVADPSPLMAVDTVVAD